jgi:putative membrane protein
VIFSVLSLVLRPLLGWVVVERARPLLGIVGLVTTFGVLLITDVLSDGIQIGGAGTWILATVIVWLATTIYESVGGRLVLAVVGTRAART